MKFRLSLIALVSIISLPALANPGYTFVPGEIGFVFHDLPSTRSRAEVVKELEAWKRNPVAASGWRNVGGEAGSVFVGTSSTTTRAEVVRELMLAKRNPVSADGWLNVGGEAGAVYVGMGRDAPTTLTARTLDARTHGRGQR